MRHITMANYVWCNTHLPSSSRAFTVAVGLWPTESVQALESSQVGEYYIIISIYKSFVYFTHCGYGRSGYIV